MHACGMKSTRGDEGSRRAREARLKRVDVEWTPTAAPVLRGQHRSARERGVFGCQPQTSCAILSEGDANLSLVPVVGVGENDCVDAEQRAPHIFCAEFAAAAVTERGAAAVTAYARAGAIITL